MRFDLIIRNDEIHVRIKTCSVNWNETYLRSLDDPHLTRRSGVGRD